MMLDSGWAISFGLIGIGVVAVFVSIWWIMRH